MASPINTQCPSCGQGFQAKSSLAGKNVRCPHCKNPFVIQVTSNEMSGFEEQVPEAQVGFPGQDLADSSKPTEKRMGGHVKNLGNRSQRQNVEKQPLDKRLVLGLVGGMLASLLVAGIAALWALGGPSPAEQKQASDNRTKGVPKEKAAIAKTVQAKPGPPKKQITGSSIVSEIKVAKKEKEKEKEKQEKVAAAPKKGSHLPLVAVIEYTSAAIGMDVLNYRAYKNVAEQEQFKVEGFDSVVFQLVNSDGRLSFKSSRNRHALFKDLGPGKLEDFRNVKRPTAGLTDRLSLVKGNVYLAYLSPERTHVLFRLDKTFRASLPKLKPRIVQPKVNGPEDIAKADLTRMPTYQSCPNKTKLKRRYEMLVADLSRFQKQNKNGCIVVGRVQLEGGGMPYVARSQSEIFRNGTFIHLVKDFESPFGVRASGYEKVDVSLKGCKGAIIDIGIIKLNKLKEPFLRNMSGKITLGEGNQDCRNVSLLMFIHPGPLNTVSGSVWSRTKPVSIPVAGDGSFKVEGLTPEKYYFHVQSPGFVPYQFVQDFTNSNSIRVNVNLQHFNDYELEYTLTEGSKSELTFPLETIRTKTLVGGEPWLFDNTDHIVGLDHCGKETFFSTWQIADLGKRDLTEFKTLDTSKIQFKKNTIALNGHLYLSRPHGDSYVLFRVKSVKKTELQHPPIKNRIQPEFEGPEFIKDLELSKFPTFVSCNSRDRFQEIVESYTDGIRKSRSWSSGPLVIGRVHLEGKEKRDRWSGRATGFPDGSFILNLPARKNRVTVSKSNPVVFRIANSLHEYYRTIEVGGKSQMVSNVYSSYDSRQSFVLGAPGYESVEVSLEKCSGLVIDVGTIRLKRLAKSKLREVSGRVAFKGARKYRNSSIGVKLENKRAMVGYSRFFQSPVSKNGTFCIKGLPPGLHQLQVYPGSAPKWVVEIDLRDGDKKDIIVEEVKSVSVQVLYVRSEKTKGKETFRKSKIRRRVIKGPLKLGQKASGIGVVLTHKDGEIKFSSSSYGSLIRDLGKGTIKGFLGTKCKTGGMTPFGEASTQMPVKKDHVYLVWDSAKESYRLIRPIEVKK